MVKGVGVGLFSGVPSPAPITTLEGWATPQLWEIPYAIVIIVAFIIFYWFSLKMGGVREVIKFAFSEPEIYTDEQLEDE